MRKRKPKAVRSHGTLRYSGDDAWILEPTSPSSQLNAFAGTQMHASVALCLLCRTTSKLHYSGGILFPEFKSPPLTSSLPATYFKCQEIKKMSME